MSETVDVPVDVKQKVLICIDLTEDENENPIGLNENVFSVEKVVRQAVCQFLRMKSLVHVETEFAIVGMLNSKAKCLSDFTLDIDSVMSIIAGFPTNKPSKPLEVNLDEFLFPILEDALRGHLPTGSPDGVLSHVCQIVLVYKSSLRIPHMNDFNYTMFKTPGVAFDALYVHDIPSEENHVEVIFESLNKVNVSGNSYVLECLNTQITAIYNTMSYLLAHPSQRTPQKYLNCDIENVLGDKQ